MARHAPRHADLHARDGTGTEPRIPVIKNGTTARTLSQNRPLTVKPTTITAPHTTSIETLTHPSPHRILNAAVLQLDPELPHSTPAKPRHSEPGRTRPPHSTHVNESQVPNDHPICWQRCYQPRFPSLRRPDIPGRTVSQGLRASPLGNRQPPSRTLIVTTAKEQRASAASIGSSPRNWTTTKGRESPHES